MVTTMSASRSSLFSSKVHDQVLRNRIEYKIECNIFKRLNRFDYTFLKYNFLDKLNLWRDKKRGGRRCDNFPQQNRIFNSVFMGPRDFSWKDDTECHTIAVYGGREVGTIVFVIPLDWARWHDPDTPILLYQSTIMYHLDLMQGIATRVESFLSRSGFYYIGFKSQSPGIPQYLKPRSLSRKCDKYWCVTYLDTPSHFFQKACFKSILLLKNINFSVLDAKVEAENLKCPVRDSKSLKIKVQPSCFELGDCTLASKDTGSCLCVECRRDYWAIIVYVRWYEEKITLDCIKILMK